MNKPNFDANTIFCSDNLPVLRNMNSECVDLIYLDPPFNKKKTFSAPIGSNADGAEFLDYFVMSDVEEQWVLEVIENHPRLYHFLQGVRLSNRNEYNYAYLVYMSMRLIECQRILKETGSIYLHCDHTMSHYIKLMMDLIFGEGNFRNEIVWCYTGPSSPGMKNFPRKHDTIFRYTKTNKWIWNQPRTPYKDPKQTLRRAMDGGKGISGEQVKKYRERGKPIEDHWSDISPVGRIKKECVGYPTQKPLALLKRIIAASSNPGDLVLDPFCGCATACVAATALQRKWVGIDVSHMAWDLMKQRMANEIPTELLNENYQFRTDVPTITARHPNKRKHIYVISSAAYPGRYKVGYASNLKRRLGAYNTASPDREYNIEFSVETEHYEACEKHIHEQFKADYEWVEADLAKVIKSIEKFLKEAGTGANALPA